MDETTIDLKDIIRTIKKRYKTILKVFWGFVVLAMVISVVIPPTYQAETTVRVKQSKGIGSSLLADLPMGGGANTKQQMSTYAEIIKSRTVVQTVIDGTQSTKEEIPAYEDFLNTITTQPVKDTEILKVKVQAKSAEEAALVANTLVNTFLDRITALVRGEQSVVREFIGARLQASKKELEQAERALEEYKRQEKIVAPDAEIRALVERYSDITKLQAESTVTLVSAQAKLVSANQQLASEKPGFIADSPLIQQYKAKLADLEVQQVGLQEKYTDKHPQVMAIAAAVAETKVKLNVEIARVVNAEAPSTNPIHQGLLQGRLQAEAEISSLAARQGAIKRIIADNEQDMLKLPAKELGLVRVMRDATVAQEIYIMLAKRFEEARISEVMQPRDVQIIDVAIAPEEPIKPKKLLNVVIAAMLGLFAGTALVFLQEYLDKSIRTAADVQYYLGLPVLGSIPDFDGDHKLATKTGFWDKVKQLFNKNDNQKIQSGF